MTIELNQSTRRNHTKSPKSLARPKTVPQGIEAEKLRAFIGCYLSDEFAKHSEVTQPDFEKEPELHIAGLFIIRLNGLNYYDLIYRCMGTYLYLRKDEKGIDIYLSMKKFMEDNGLRLPSTDLNEYTKEWEKVSA